MTALNLVAADASALETVAKRARPATLCGHLLDAVAVCETHEAQREISGDRRFRRIEVPTSTQDRVRFLKQWAREQRRRALAGGAWSLLVLPVFASAAAAQSEDVTSLSSAESVVGAAVQADGSLLVSFEDGSTVLVPEGQYSVTADGQFLVDADALAGTPAAAHGAFAALGAALVGGAVASGGSSGTGGGTGGGGGGDDATPTTSGFVIDGYISGATVFRDENGNGVLDDDEASVQTNDQGAFSGLGGDLSAPIVSIGGTDISTGLAFEGTLKAPAGSTVISPVTTLVQEIVEADDTGATTVDEAIAQVNTALGLEDDTDLLNEDPIASENDDLFAAGAKVANIVNVGVAAGAEEEAIIAELAELITEASDDPSAPDNLLSDDDSIEEVLTEALEDGALSETSIENLSSTIANANSAVDAAVEDPNVTDVNDAIADVQQVVQSEIAGEVADQVEDGEEIAEVTQEEIEDEAENAEDVDGGVVNFGTGFSEGFSEPVTLGDSTVSEHGVWYEDRYAPAAFEVVEDFGTVDQDFTGESVLRLTTDPVVDQDPFRQTQGRKLDLPDGSTEASIGLYIDPAWEPAVDATTGFRQAGFWTTALDAEGAIGAYPIIEFSTLDGVATFRVFTGVSETMWQEITLPEGIPYGEFIDLAIAVNDDGSVTYRIGTETFTTDNSDPNNTFDVVSLDNVILQGYNQDPTDEDAAREAYSIYWDDLAANGDFVEDNTNLADYEQVNFAEIPYDVAPGVELTLTMAQADNLQIGGSGTVKLVGEFDGSTDLSGITAPIDATELEAIDATITVEEADGLQVDLPADAILNIDVDYADLSTDNPSLTPEIDLSGITVNGSNSPADLINVLDAGSVEETFKLLWNYADNNYYDALPGGTPDVNAANIELGNLYAQYLLDGGEPLLDIVQTKVSGDPDFDVRQQSLHDNLLGNLKDSVVESRISSNALDEDNRDEAGLQFGDRPIYSGTLTDTDDLLATQVWDIANGIPRSDFAVNRGEIYVLNGDTLVDADDDSINGITSFDDLSDAIDAAADGAYILVGSGTHIEGDQIVVTSSLNIVGVDGAVVQGRFFVDSDGTQDVAVNVSNLDVVVTQPDFDEVSSQNALNNFHGFYLRGDGITLNLEDVDFTAQENPDVTASLANEVPPEENVFSSRGVLNEIRTDAEINIVGGSFDGLTSAIYINPPATDGVGTTLNVDGTTFLNSGIGTDGPGAVTVVNSTFDGARIGFGADWENGGLTLQNNTFVSETDQVRVFFARPEGPVEVPTDLPIWDDATIAQSANRFGNSFLEEITGTDGDDIIIDNTLDTEIDLGGGGSDFILLTLGVEDEGVNLIVGFTAGDASVTGADVIAFNFVDDADLLLPGFNFEAVGQSDTIGEETGFVMFSDQVGDGSIDPLYGDLVSTGLSDTDAAAILTVAESIAFEQSGGLLMAVPVSSGDSTLIVGVDFGTTEDGDEEVFALALLDGADRDLTADNLYDFTAVTANT